MITTLPKDIQDAIELLYEFADDACISMRTQQECDNEGFECETDSAWHLTFVISIPKKDKI